MPHTETCPRCGRWLDCDCPDGEHCECEQETRRKDHTEQLREKLMAVPPILPDWTA